ncbi:MAG: hypothetical protein ACFB50_12225 [Rubrobacteraceae bacterium]
MEQRIKRRRLGHRGLEVSALGLGCMGMSEFYGATNDDQAVAAIRRSIEFGGIFLTRLERSCACTPPAP